MNAFFKVDQLLDDVICKSSKDFAICLLSEWSVGTPDGGPTKMWLWLYFSSWRCRHLYSLCPLCGSEGIVPRLVVLNWLIASCFNVVERSVISVLQDGMFSLGLVGDGAVKVSCPGVQIGESPGKDVLPTVAPLPNPNITSAGTPVGQRQNPIIQLPKPQVPVTLQPKSPVAPEGQNPQPYQFPYYFWPPQPPQAPGLLTPGPPQKPASPTPKTEVQEPVTQPKPPKTHVNKNPVASEGQNPQPYQFPYYFWPPQLPQAPDLTPGLPQKPASPTPKTEVQEPVTQPKPPKTHVNKNPVASEGQNPQPYQFPYYFWPPQLPQAPDLTPGLPQKPASPTPKTEVQEPVTQPKPPKTHVNKNPVAPDGQNPQPYQLPYYFWPLQPSEAPDLLTPGLPQKPALPKPKTEVQEPVTQRMPPKTHVNKNLVPKSQNPQPYQFPYYFWPLQPSQAPDLLTPGPPQKPASPTPMTEVQEPVTQPMPPKTHVNKNLVPKSQNPQPYQFPYYFWPLQPSQAPDLLTPGPPQKPASPTPMTEVQEPVTQPKPPKTHVNKNPVAPEGQNSQPYQFPYYFWPPQLPQAPDLTSGLLQKSASTTPKTEVQEPVTQPKPPKTHVNKNSVAPDGQNPHPYQFPYYFWPLQPSEAPDLLTPGLPQKPALPTPKTEVQEPVTQPMPPKTHVNKNLVPKSPNPQPYQFPYYFWPLQPSQAPDLLTPGPPQKPASTTPKTKVQAPVTQPKPPKSEVKMNLPPSDPLFTVGQTKPESGPGPGYNPLIQCPQKCPSGLSDCCVSFSYHQHDHYMYPPKDDDRTKSEPEPRYKSLIQCHQKCPSGLSDCCVSFSYHRHDHYVYPPKDDRKIADFMSFSALGKSVPEELQGIPRSGPPEPTEASHDTTLKPPPQNEVEDLIQTRRFDTNKSNGVLAYNPPEGILSLLKMANPPNNQDLPQSFDPSQSETPPPTYKLQRPLNQGQFMILDPGMVHYNMFQDAQASSGDYFGDYFEAVQPVSNAKKFEKLTSARPFTNGYVLLEHGPPGSDPSSPKAARGLGRSHTHLVFEPLSNYQQSQGKSHLAQPGNQMDTMYRSQAHWTGPDPHYSVPLSYAAQTGQFQSNHNLGQTFEGLHSSVDSYPNGK